MHANTRPPMHTPIPWEKSAASWAPRAELAIRNTRNTPRDETTKTVPPALQGCQGLVEGSRDCLGGSEGPACSRRRAA
eukprot:10615427-Alexandrium_andersonii.AAC.1